MIVLGAERVVKDRDIGALEDVARRYFFTTAGETACVLLTYEHSYRGQPRLLHRFTRVVY